MRPEGGGGYGWSEDQEPVDHDDRDAPAWQEMTPWRPGDRSTRGEAPSSWSTPSSPAADLSPRGPQRVFDQGDRVNAVKPVGGVLGGAVPAGTGGAVESVNVNLFDTTLTVRFDNGLTEEVRESDVKYDSGWY